MPATYLSPNSGNYTVPRGYMTMLNITAGETTYQDMGNVTQMELLVEPTNLDHYSSRQGVQVKDFVAVTRLAATLTWILDEFTARNMANAVLGTAQESGSVAIDLMATPQIYAALEFFGTNVVGPVWDFNFPYVLITPQKAVSMIAEGSGTWGTFSMKGDVLRSPTVAAFAGQITNQFGLATSVSFH